jgi:hypothetical protein
MSPMPKWTKQQWQVMMDKIDKPLEMSPYYNKCALYVTMSMIDSDSSNTLKAIEPDELKYF